ncbi:tol-pal system-associated acyl-CoA thioesterase [Amaricoccus tamworthensis]|uniref:tol-pal system-associated acyl-CoA thioesterase n=1 Tax=Amaricoccus tamworthensis TaxID=57002 RepID=UPI003C7DB3C9
MLRKPANYHLRVYYEDTDAGGIVYYANYLKFAERARTEALLDLGLSQTDLRERLGLGFVVRTVTVDYWAPAKFEDQLTVTTEVLNLWGARVAMAQDIMRDGEILARCAVSLAVVGTNGKPKRLPLEIRNKLETLNRADSRP